MRSLSSLLSLLTISVGLSFADALLPAIVGFSKAFAQSAPPSTTRTLLDIQGVLEPGDAVLAEDNTLYDEYTFEGRTGQRISIVMESLAFNTYLLLLNPTGKTIAHNDDYQTATNAMLILTLPQDGVYRVIANASGAWSQGHYRLTVLETAPQQAEPILSLVANQQIRAAQLYQQGAQRLEGSDFQSALQYFEQALAIYQEVGDRPGEGVTLNEIGVVYYNLGRYQEALESYQQSLTIRQEVGNRPGEGVTLHNIGVVYYNLGRYQEALESYQQSLAIRREVGDRRDEGSTLDEIGGVYRELGRYSEALESYQQSLAIRREVGDRRDEGVTFNRIGWVYEVMGRYSEALEAYQQALTIRREVGDRSGEGVSLNSIAGIHYVLGHFPQALEIYQQALAIRRELGDRSGESITLNDIALLYTEVRRYPQALETYQQSLDIARELGDRRGEGGTLNNIGVVYSEMESYSQALEAYQQALTIRREFSDRFGEAYTLYNIGSSLFKIGRFAESSEALASSIQVWESLSPGLRDQDRVSVFEGGRRAHRIWQRALIAENDIGQALEASERGRARAFVGQLALRLGSLVAEDLVTSNIPTLEQLKQIAQEQSAVLVEYSIVSDNELYIWVVQPNGELAFHQADPSQLPTPLPELVLGARTAMGINGGRQIVGVRPTSAVMVQQTSQLTQKLQQLHQLLIEPIAAHLPTDPNTPVIFIPQDELFLVPFAALQDRQGEALIEQHTILTSPSIQLLAKTRERRSQLSDSAAQDVLIVGNPTMPRISLAVGDPPQQLTPLPGAEQEVRVIAPLFNTQPLIGNQATEATVLERFNDARIIHLATHGLLDEQQGLDSGIALAPNGNGQPNDGLLTAAEIAQMQLNAELVVLSACDTGQGRITGDGVIGLSRSLITAGVPSVVVSLWAVPDAPTAELMTEFYREWQRSGSKAQALRQAMLTIRSNPQYANPRNWAAFTLIGEAQ